jgi:orotate phosphoribosyltransferase
MTAVVQLKETRDSKLSQQESQLLQVIRERSFRRGKFILSSGVESELYFNLKSTMMFALGAHLSALAFLSRIREERADYIGGLEMGAVPILGSLAAISASEGRPIQTFFVRKEPKKHGTKDLIEGLAAGESLAGKRVIIADDVATTGGSILKAIKATREAGAEVDCALVLVDRDEGATEALRNEGVRLLSVFRTSDFL